jgi:hypothetical protein
VSDTVDPSLALQDVIMKYLPASHDIAPPEGPPLDLRHNEGLCFDFCVSVSMAGSPKLGCAYCRIWNPPLLLMPLLFHKQCIGYLSIYSINSRYQFKWRA